MEYCGVTAISEGSGCFEELGLNACSVSLEITLFRHFLIIWDEDNAYKSWKGAVTNGNSLAAGREHWQNYRN